MGSQIDLERLRESNCHGVDSLRGYAHENGKMTSQLEDCEVVSGVHGAKGATLCPITCITCQKIGESMSKVSSPLSAQFSESLNGGYALNYKCCSEVVGSILEDSPQTPKEGAFSPFVSGPEEMCLAPLGKKLMKENGRIVARRFSFEDADECKVNEEEEAGVHAKNVLLDTVSGSLLEANILKQRKDFLAENQPLEMVGCSTPTLLPRLTGIAETCPGPPSKAVTPKPLNIEEGLCKKLEF